MKKTLRYSSTFQKELAERPHLMVYNHLFKKMQQILIEMKGFFPMSTIPFE